MSKRRQPVLAYLESLQAVRATGKATDEQSYKSSLETLLTAVGEKFDPELFATMELRSEGAGRPDLGVFEKKSNNLRLVVEVKGPADDIYDTARGEQVSKYWKRYGFVLVTNLREFVFVARDAHSGDARIEARYQMSRTVEVFETAKSAALAGEHEQGLSDFLQGVFARPAPILKPNDLATDLARHAREAKRRLGWHSVEALRPLQDAFESALGLTFEGDKGLDFFRSSLVQTLFYGLFSGWMLWRQSPPKGKRTSDFDWKDASDFLALPLIGDLFDEVAKPKRLTELDLREPLEWAADSLNRVEHAEFFETFDAEHAITLFYEPFLEAFDPELRKQLGVWYTPPEIVKYMVGRVDQLLRSELGITDGLADENVFVLDPATGTASYLVEVARRIHQTLEENGAGALAAADVKRALTTRVFGFEILPAPYVVAHLQLGILLKSLGASLASKERAGVYLTNALTGWEPPKGAKQTLAFPFLQDEQDQAAKVKREAPIIVILGNPPYNAFAGVAQQEEAELISPYYEGIAAYGATTRSLNDLYIRFFRLAERRIAEISGRGIVCFISNYSWLDGLSHPVMRKRLLDGFDVLVVDNCNGDKYRTGKRTPDGRPDQSMFTTDQKPVGIQVGTAIATFVRKTNKRKNASANAVVFYRDLWGTGNAKRASLLTSLKSPPGTRTYARVKADASSRFVIRPRDDAGNYLAWPSLPKVHPAYYSGVKSDSGELVLDIDRARLEQRMRRYCDSTIAWTDLLEVEPGAAQVPAGEEPRDVRARMIKQRFDPDKIKRFLFRPFDVRWIYYEPSTGIIARARPEFAESVSHANFLLEARQRLTTSHFDRGLVTNCLADTLGNGSSQFLPLRVRHEEMLNGDSFQPNIDQAVLSAVCAAAKRPVHKKDGHTFSDHAIALSESVFFHTLAVLWSPAYRKQNQAALRQDWPRVPIPADPKLLHASAALGRQLADLLLPDQRVPGVTAGKLRADLKSLATWHKVGGKPIDPNQDLDVTAAWGFRGQKNAVMCGKGKVTPNDADPKEAVDIWLNDAICWRNVPCSVWEMTIGGYPVVKKWLSYREKRVLGRALKMDEVTYVTEMVRRLAAILALGPELDANYTACAKDTIHFA